MKKFLISSLVAVVASVTFSLVLSAPAGAGQAPTIAAAASADPYQRMVDTRCVIKTFKNVIKAGTKVKVRFTIKENAPDANPRTRVNLTKKRNGKALNPKKTNYGKRWYNGGSRIFNLGRVTVPDKYRFTLTTKDNPGSRFRDTSCTTVTITVRR